MVQPLIAQSLSRRALTHLMTEAKKSQAAPPQTEEYRSASDRCFLMASATPPADSLVGDGCSSSACTVGTGVMAREGSHPTLCGTAAGGAFAPALLLDPEAHRGVALLLAG